MYNRDEASRIRQEFWTAFGRYMNPVLSAEGMKINWINYHTGLKDVHFRMDAGLTSATIFISIEHSDSEIRELFYEQFKELATMLRSSVGEEWDWQPEVELEGHRNVSRIAKTFTGVSIMSKDQWPDLISFFKPRIIALDSFWENGKYAFDTLK
ncbi:MAG: DUF4268 domain-containing protein [Chryseolinea sp.]